MATLVTTRDRTQTDRRGATTSPAPTIDTIPSQMATTGFMTRALELVDQLTFDDVDFGFTAGDVASDLRHGR